MIVVDTSAFAAVLFQEEDGEELLDLMSRERVMIGAPTVFELKLIVTKRIGPEALPEVERIMRTTKVDVVPWTTSHIAAALDALRRFGGRPARLNYGDCMAYAVAKVAGCPLLYKGGDFASTDIVAAR